MSFDIGQRFDGRRDDDAVPFLGPILLREIQARLLNSPQDATLRRYDWYEHLARAIASTPASFDRTLLVYALAERARISKSAFSAHFRAVTALTPGRS